jgi:hypothetical protein
MVMRLPRDETMYKKSNKEKKRNPPKINIGVVVLKQTHANLSI